MCEEDLRSILLRNHIRNKDEVIDAYNLDAPLASFPILIEEKDELENFISMLEEHFFVKVREVKEEMSSFLTGIQREEKVDIDMFNGWRLVFVSRFKTLVDVAMHYEGLPDMYADLSGILHGKPIDEVFKYCKEEGLTDLVKVIPKEVDEEVANP